MPHGVDIVKQVVESCAAYGIKVGVYYSINRNAYLGVWDPGRVQPGAKVSQAQWDDILLQQLTELWSNYGDLVELWYDGGYNLGPDMAVKLKALALTLQPNAVNFNGCEEGLPNAVDWIGTESGHAPYPLWYAMDGCGTGAFETPFHRHRSTRPRPRPLVVCLQPAGSI